MEEIYEELYELLHETDNLSAIKYIKDIFDEYNDKIDINYRFENGMTMLMVACSNFNTDAVKILLCYNPDIQLKDDFGNTSMLHVMKKYKDFIFELIYFLTNEIIEIILQLRNSTILDEEIIKKLNNDRIFLIYNFFSCHYISKNESEAIFLMIVRGTFRGNIESVDNILSLFIEHNDLNMINLILSKRNLLSSLKLFIEIGVPEKNVLDFSNEIILNKHSNLFLEII